MSATSEWDGHPDSNPEYMLSAQFQFDICLWVWMGLKCPNHSVDRRLARFATLSSLIPRLEHPLILNTEYCGVWQGQTQRNDPHNIHGPQSVFTLAVSVVTGSVNDHITMALQLDFPPGYYNTAASKEPLLRSLQTGKHWCLTSRAVIRSSACKSL